jgi:uncharacterized protein YuzE
MWLEYDSEADAAYIWLREDMGRAFGLDLDSSRYVDFGADQRPIGIELLHVSRGVDATGLPAREQIEVLLRRHHIRLY